MAGLRLLTLLLLILSTLATPALSAPKGQPSPTIAPSARDKCPVCGMFVSKFPDWIASTRLKSGTVYYFDGPKDMFIHYFDSPRYTPGGKKADIDYMMVKEYYSLKMIDARNAFFVIGSDIYGPMGNELIPFASRKDADSFMADHKGKKVLRFNEITRELIKSLN